MIQYFILFFSVNREPASASSWTRPGGAANKSSLPNLVYSTALFNHSIINVPVSVLRASSEETEATRAKQVCLRPALTVCSLFCGS